MKKILFLMLIGACISFSYEYANAGIGKKIATWGAGKAIDAGKTAAAVYGAKKVMEKNGMEYQAKALDEYGWGAAAKRVWEEGKRGWKVYKESKNQGRP